MRFKLQLNSALPLVAALMLGAPLATTAQTFITPSKGNETKMSNPALNRWQRMTPIERDSLRNAARLNKPMMFRKIAQRAADGTTIQAGGNKGVAKGTSKAIEGVIAEWNAKLAAGAPLRAPLYANSDSITNSKLTWYAYIPKSTGLTPGFYKLALGPNPSAELLSQYDPNPYGSGSYFGFGSGIVDGKLYVMRVDASWWDLGWVMGNYSTVDLSTGQVEYYGGLAYADYWNFCGYATAQAADGTVYGQFFNNSTDPTDCVWGTRDYSAMTKIRDFGPSSKIISIALGVTSDGKLYSVGEDGNLYQVSTEDGKETLIGATGIKPYSVNGTLAPSSGEIDPKTNTFYWAAVDGDGKAGLYTVDLKTGQATRVSDWGDLGNIELQALTGVVPPAEDGAPAIATNLSLGFEGGSTTGKIYFTAPSTTYAGDDLDEDTPLTYEVRSSSDVLATGTVLPGEEDSATITVPEGQNTISITTSNSVGKSPVAKISQWIGYDVPAYPTNAKATVDDKTGKVNITWTAPTRVYHSGYMGDFTYNIYQRVGRQDSLIGTSDTASFDYQLPEGPMSAYMFSVETVNGTQKSTSKANTGVVAWGDPLRTPYDEEFTDNNRWAYFKVIDSNNDNNTWKKGNKYAYTSNGWDKDQDDWLITPEINLKAGNTYILNYYIAQNYAWYKGTKLQIKYGKFADKVRTIEGLDKVIADTITLDSIDKNKNPIVRNDTIVVTEDGAYAFGFHDVSPVARTGVVVGPITLTKVRQPNTPDSVRYLSVTPATDGDMRAQIIFQAPQKDISGNKLTDNIPWIDLQRNGKTIFTFRDVVPGSYLQYSDEDDENIKVGNNTYSVVCYLTDEDPSATVSQTAYVGVGIPKPVTNVAIDENVANKSIDFSWDKVSSEGANGHRVKVNEVEYGVFSMAPSYFGGYYHDKLLGATYDENISVPFDTYVGDPTVNTWAVVAANEAGMSDDYQVAFVSGKPKNLPYEEHFPTGAPSVYPYFTHTIDQKWGAYGHDRLSSDGDGQSFDVFAYRDTINNNPVVSVVTSPKFDISTAEHPTLIYDVNETVSNGGGKQIAGIVEAGPVITELTPQPVEAQLPDDFKRYKVALDNYKSLGAVSFGLGGRFNNTGGIQVGANTYGAYIDFDNVHLLDLRSKNIGVRSITTQPSVKGGSTANINFVIENVGEEDASNYIVKAEADGKVFFTDTVADALPLLGQREFKAELPTTIYDESHDIDIKVTAELAGDEVSDNDTATTKLPLVASTYPAPEGVNGTQAGNDIELTWSAPTSDEATVTEDFDDVTKFKPYDIGGINDSTFVGHIADWTVLNEDHGATAGPNVPFENNGVVKSFQVINVDTLNTLASGADEAFPTRSGSQELISFDGYTGSTDHWLISPELSGKAQDISLYYRQIDNTNGNESFQVLASNGGLDPADFTVVKTQAVSGLAYAQAKVSLPDSTKYFAVRHTAGTYGLQLDDITYTIGSGAPVGYNLYVDGQLYKNLGTDDVTVSADGTISFVYEDAADGETHEYAISAVYANGESRPVPVTIKTTNAIKAITLAPGEKVDIYTVDGQLVRRQATGFDGLNSGVYVVKGQKVIVK